MLSTSCKYALRASVYLMSLASSGRKAGMKEVAEEIGANEHTTGKILQLLVRERIISSAKGPTGGFYISPDAASIFLIDIVKVTDGTQLFFECGLGLSKCSALEPCPIHHTYKATRDKLYNEFCTITIQELASNIEKGTTYLRR